MKFLTFELATLAALILYGLTDQVAYTMFAIAFFRLIIIGAVIATYRGSVSRQAMVVLNWWAGLHIMIITSLCVWWNGWQIYAYLAYIATLLGMNAALSYRAIADNTESPNADR